MKIRDLIYHLADDMEIVIQDAIIKTGETYPLFEGEVQNTPHWIVDKELTASECVEVRDGVLVIDVSKPANWAKRKNPGGKGYKLAWEILRAQITLDAARRCSWFHRKILCELLRIMNELEQETAQ